MVKIGPCEVARRLIAQYRIAQEVHHTLLHQVPHMDHVSVHLNPARTEGAHELTDHHVSAEARRAYRALTLAAAGRRAPGPGDDTDHIAHH